MMLKTEVFLALRYLFRGRARHISFISIISCLGVMLGVATLIVVISVMNGFDKDLMSKLLRFNYHITIESVRREIPEGVIKRVRNTEGVKGAAIFLQTQVFGKFNDYIVPIIVRGIDFSSRYEKKTFYKYVLKEKGNEGFFVGDGLRKKFLLGDRISYYPLSRKLRLKESKIRGVFKIGLYDIDNNYLVCNINEAKALGNNYLLFLGVRVNDPFKAAAVKSQLKNLEDDGFMVNTWIETNGALFSALKLEKITMFVILSLIVVVASFNIFSTLTIKVVEKTKDIGILKSLGFNSGHILSIFSIQGLMLGVIGVAAGVILGITLCFVLKEYHFIKLPQEIYYISYLPVTVKTKDIALISSLGILLSFISSLFPAVRASRLKPSEALRYG